MFILMIALNLKILSHSVLYQQRTHLGKKKKTRQHSVTNYHAYMYYLFDAREICFLCLFSLLMISFQWLYQKVRPFPYNRTNFQFCILSGFYSLMRKALVYNFTNRFWIRSWKLFLFIGTINVPRTPTNIKLIESQTVIYSELRSQSNGNSS